MSETQLISPALISEPKKLDECEFTGVQTIVASNDAATCIKDEDEDLEDGEIDDDDDNDDVVAITMIKPNEVNSNTIKEKLPIENKLNITPENVVTIELSDDQTLSPATVLQPVKPKKPKPVEDDHLSSIEKQLANALKKKGIEPIAPVLETHVIEDYDEEMQSGQHSSSRSSKRRKRKKTREDKEKSKSHSEKKKSRYESPDPTKSQPIDIVELDDEMDDFEMLNVRGGSPPPNSHLPLPIMPTNYNDQMYGSGDESDYSYDSYDSTNETDSPRNDSRRKRRNKKDKERKRRSERSGRQSKRHRREDSPEEPRKLELCKFYLLECCAKRDKCSYMHGDFPCKYYYLGMECAQKDECKFSHGEPLTEQLRNILLKHLEMAPKEILGNFKRIPREQAIAQITKRHEELCKEFNIENTWSSVPNLPGNFNRRNNEQNQKQQQQLQQHQQQQQKQQKNKQQQQKQQQQSISNIPSLLDMVIKPPNELSHLGGSNSPMHSGDRQQRKSRWNDSSPNELNIIRSNNMGPSYLDIKNLTGILSDEHIAALSSLGIVNLEQVNQLTVGQLNQIGLNIAEINDIQLNAKNMAKLGGLSSKSSALSLSETFKNSPSRYSPKSDVGSTTPDYNEPPEVNTKLMLKKSLEPDMFGSNSNSNSNNGVVMVDYSQYLKDSNLPFDRNDDDEKDDEQLIIDDGNADGNEDNQFGSSQSKYGNYDMKKRKDSQSDSEQQQHQHQLTTPILKMPDFSSALRNPFSSMNPFNKKTQDPRISKQNSSPTESTNKKSSTTNDTDSDDERYYASRGRRSRSVTPTRSGSSTPEASQSPRFEDFGTANAYMKKPKARENPKYERQTMYDFDVKRAAVEDEERAAKSIKADKDMRFLEGANISGGDIDLRLPFLPVTYTPATEIDASITSHLPMTYKVFEVDIKPTSYVELRQNFKSDQTNDPRLRRILGLPETSHTRTAAQALNRSVRKLSQTIASPESSDGASPKYYTPSMSAIDDQRSQRRKAEETSNSKTTTTTTTAPPQQLRLDPRRAARQAAETQNSPPVTGAATAATQQPQNNAVKQNIEIRNYLQKSEWYKNLNSKFKIMVNQQLALVSTELKKFHQDPSPNKIFDISFIVNNSTLQQILTNLGIFIDDNGEVAHIDGDSDEASAQTTQEMLGNKSANGIVLPNLSQPPPMQQQQQQNQQQQQQQQQVLDFLRGPPPTMLNAPPAMNMQQFNAPPPNTRPSLLGLPPAVAAGGGGVGVPPRNPFNPFAGNPVNPFTSGPSLLGPGPGLASNIPIGFNNFNGPPNMQQQQRNFGNMPGIGNGNQQRNQRNQRRNNFNNQPNNVGGNQ